MDARFASPRKKDVNALRTLKRCLDFVAARSYRRVKLKLVFRVLVYVYVFLCYTELRGGVEEGDVRDEKTGGRQTSNPAEACTSAFSVHLSNVDLEKPPYERGSMPS